MSQNLSAAKSARTISIATLASRILGFVRDMLMASIFGATFYSDSFLVAYRIPNLLRRLFGEGALNSSFIPVFVKSKARDPQKAQQLATNVFWVLLIILIIVSVMGVVFSEEIVKVMTFSFSDSQAGVSTLSAPHNSAGQTDSQTALQTLSQTGVTGPELAIKLTKIMFPYILFICLAALGMGYLNSFSSFFIPALSPVLLNISMIGYLYFIGAGLDSSPESMEAKCTSLAWAVMAGGLMQFLIHIPPMRKRGFRFFPFTGFADPLIKQIALLMAPAALGLAVSQLNIFVDTVLAWQLGAGAVSALYYSNRLVQLPLAIFGIAVSTAFLPIFSKAAISKNPKDLIDSFSYALRTVMFITFPAAAGLITAGGPIIKLLFLRGKFTLTGAVSTEHALICYASGLFFFAAINLTVKIFYSLELPEYPVRAGIYSMILNIVLNLILMIPLGHAGLALATSIAAFFNLSLLLIRFKKIKGHIMGRVLLKSFLRIFSSSLIMGLAVYAVKTSFPVYTDQAAAKALITGLLITTGIITYYICVKLLKCPELQIFKSLMIPERFHNNRYI